MSWWPNGLSYGIPLLLAVLLVAKLLPLPATYHPLTLFRFFAKQLATKVNPDINRSIQQQTLSGSLAIVVTLCPVLIILFAFYQFSELPLVLDALVLYFSLDWSDRRTTADCIAKNLQRQQLTLAREHARSILLRDTLTMSSMGLSKATIESLLLQSGRLFVGVIIFFLLGGGIAALTYRLLQALQQQWNPKLPQFQYFGMPVTKIANFCAAPALLLCSLIIALQYGVKRCYAQCYQPFHRFTPVAHWTLCCTSIALHCNLGGPAFYGGKKYQRSRITAGREPTPSDIGRCLKLLGFVHGFIILLLCSALLLQLALLFQH